MNEDNLASNQFDKPVAYDAEGQPLYAHPSPIDEPVSAPVISTDNKDADSRSLETKLKHDSSKRYYPDLSLRDDEYVISAIRRHSIGLFLPFTAGVLMMAASLSALFNYDLFVNMFSLTGPAAEVSIMVVPLLLLTTVIAIGTYITYFVYSSNRLFLTNEGIIQDVQVSLFSHIEQTVSLENIEDASFQQKGIFQQFFDYGTIMISIEGNAKSYRFTYASHPKEHIDMLNNTIEALRDIRAK